MCEAVSNEGENSDTYMSIVTVVATRKVADDTTMESHSDRLFLLFLPTVKL